MQCEVDIHILLDFYFYFRAVLQFIFDQYLHSISKRRRYRRCRTIGLIKARELFQLLCQGGLLEPWF